MRIWFVGAALVAVAGACSSSPLGGGGTGGTAGGVAGATGAGGDSGTTGQAGAGAATGGGGAGFPDCLNALFAMCPTEGTCQSPAGGSGLDVCFASGVRVASRQTTQCGATDGGRYATTTSEVRKADGTLCYTAVNMADCSAGLESGTITWTDAAGHEVGVETYGFAHWSIACSDTGQTNECSGPCTAAAPGMSYSRNCASGSCP